MLRKHLSQYGDDELAAEVARHVDEKVPESKRLDYKQAPSLNSRKGKREAAKDISSFANEIGGYVLYGIPEEREALPDGTKSAIAKKPYGIDPIPGLEGRLEDIYVEAIHPRLPDLGIRKVATEYEGKVVYVAWHSESWMGPHMVQAYGDNSYYRRGLLRAVKMDEHEVRQKYLQVRSQLDRARHYLESRQINLCAQPPVKSKTHFVCCPIRLVDDRVDFFSRPMQEWLRENYALVHKTEVHEWRPSYHGVRATRQFSYESSIAGTYCELHRNGAVNYFHDTDLHYPGEGYPGGFVAVTEVLEYLRAFVLLCGKFYREVGYYEPVALRLRITAVQKIGFYFSKARKRSYQFYSFEDPLTKLATPEGVLQIDITAPASQAMSEPMTLVKAVADRIYNTFGHNEAYCFDEKLNLLPR